MTYPHPQYAVKVSISLPPAHMTAVRVYARGNGIGISAAIARLIEATLEVDQFAPKDVTIGGVKYVRA